MSGQAACRPGSPAPFHFGRFKTIEVIFVIALLVSTILYYMSTRVLIITYAVNGLITQAL